MSYETLLVETRGAVTLITINRPQALNALSRVVLKELTAVFAAYEADDSQGCAVLTGSGDKAFAAGADIAEMAKLSAADFYLQAFFDGWQRDIVARVRKPWIAAVNGFALGGGCELAMMADFILASEKAKFGQPEINLGIVAGMGGTQRLTRFVGKSKSMDMHLTGRFMDAAEADVLAYGVRPLKATGSGGGLDRVPGVSNPRTAARSDIPAPSVAGVHCRLGR